MSYNKTILMGRLTRDIDLRTIPSGTSVGEFGIAVDDGFGDNKKVCFIDVTVWGKQAEFVSQWFKKGDPIFVEGRLSLDQWEDKNGGGKRSKHRIIAEKVSFTLNKKNGAAPQQQQTQQQPTNETPQGWNNNESIDEIPF